MLVSKETELRRRYDVRWRLTGVATRRAGWVADPDGLNPLAIINGHWPAPPVQPCRDVREWLEKARADVLFEASSLDAQTGQPAIEHLKAALELYFIQDFGIVPTIFSVRYFQNDLTVDVGVVFSLYKAGASGMKTLGDYVFNTTFDVIPMVSGSYHF